MSNSFAIDHKSYNVYISSNDKVSGTNNNGVYQINWDNFLPRSEQDYKVVFSFQSSTGSYKDVVYLTQNLNALTYSAAKVVMNTKGRAYSFDTSNRSNSNTLGYIQRDSQSSGTSGNTLTAFYMQNAPKTVSRPTEDIITISIYNSWGDGKTLMTDTNPYAGYVFTGNGSITTNTMTMAAAQPNLTVGTYISGTGVRVGTMVTAILTTSTFTVSGASQIVALTNLTGKSEYGKALGDMSSWNMIMEWIPIGDKSKANQA
jgi:hypothetical protein